MEILAKVSVMNAEIILNIIKTQHTFVPTEIACIVPVLTWNTNYQRHQIKDTSFNVKLKSK